MPHFIIECSQDVIKQRTPDELMNAVYYTAETSGLFAQGDIKVRIQPFDYYKLGENKHSFIHVSGHIMEGRTTEQKAKLSRKIIEKLTEMFPIVPIISMNIGEFEKATYCNKALIDPLNKTQDRHFKN